MNFEDFRSYCLGFSGVEEGFPFDQTTLVFKVRGRMFALVDLESKPMSISLKCDAELAVDLRGRYSSVGPGYHMNKRYWNTVLVDGSVDDELIKQWVAHSYERVFALLPKKIQREF